MIALDTNILVYAHRQDSPFHRDARRLVAELAEGPAAWAIPWPCLHEFLAIVTHTKIFRPPTPAADAVLQVEAWLESPSLTLLGETTDHFAALKELLTRSAVTGPAVHDARIAAICATHRISVLYTVDRDFSRFKGLRIENPFG